MPLPPLSTTSPLDWRYTAEGGANLVLSFSGPPDSPYSGRALRLRKRKKRARGGKEDEVVPSEVGVEFGRVVVEPLLGREQVPEMELVALAREWLEALVQRLREEKARPPEREEEDEVDLDAKQAVVVEDLISGEGVLAVEIKPKWGFLPSTTHLSSATLPLKRNYCRFCMHRYHKRTSSASSPPCVDDLSAALAEHEKGYCPLDLYSQDPLRVRHALDCLYDGWACSNGEGNSFRVFVDGQKLSPQDPATAERIDATLFSLSGRHQASSTSNSSVVPPPPATLPNILFPILLASPLLPTLSRLQSTLDCLDIEGLAQLLKDDEQVNVDITRPDVDLSPLGEQPMLEEWTAWMEDHLHLLPHPPSPPPFSATNSASPPPPPSVFFPSPRSALKSALCVEHARAAILAYLLSATFKDCSLIFRIPLPSPSSTSSAPSASSARFPEATVKAIDLDPKPIKRLGKYWRMDQEIVRGWGDMLEKRSEEEREKVRKCRE